MSSNVLKRVVSAEHVGGHRIRLRFEDGVEGEVDLRDVVRFRGVLKPLEDPAFVARVGLDREFGSVQWPGEVDLDPVILYCAVKGVPVPAFGRARKTPVGASRRAGRRRSARTKGRRRGAA